MPKTKEKYPMAAKLRRSTEHKILVDFMEWLTEERDQPYELAYLSDTVNPMLTPCMVRNENLIFEYLGIDPKKLDEERRQMLEEMQNVDKKGG